MLPLESCLSSLDIDALNGGRIDRRPRSEPNERALRAGRGQGRSSGTNRGVANWGGAQHVTRLPKWHTASRARNDNVHILRVVRDASRNDGTGTDDARGRARARRSNAARSDGAPAGTRGTKAIGAGRLADGAVAREATSGIRDPECSRQRQVRLGHGKHSGTGGSDGYMRWGDGEGGRG